MLMCESLTQPKKLYIPIFGGIRLHNQLKMSLNGVRQ